MYSTYSVCVCVVGGGTCTVHAVCVVGGGTCTVHAVCVCVVRGGTCTGLASVPGQFFMEKVGPGAEVRVLTSYK